MHTLEDIKNMLEKENPRLTIWICKNYMGIQSECKEDNKTLIDIFNKCNEIIKINKINGICDIYFYNK